MHQYWYVNSKRNGELYNNSIAIPLLYSQPQISKFEKINGLGIPEDWSCRIYPVGWDSSVGHAGFNSPKQPFPWDQSLHHAGMFPQGHLPTVQPSANPFSFNANGQPMNWGVFGNPVGWGGQGNAMGWGVTWSPMGWGNNGGNGQPMNWGGQGNVMGWGVPWSPMGWGNNGGNGQPGMFGNLLTMGKSTMNGIGMINSLIGMGKLFF
ncbi:hypothetical protein IGI01_25960 [Bacillus thuringiensis]|nr:hypothetical protein [Bacillus thuringiensis]